MNLFEFLQWCIEVPWRLAFLMVFMFVLDMVIVHILATLKGTHRD